MKDNLEQAIKDSIERKANKKLKQAVDGGIEALEIKTDKELQNFLTNIDVTEIAL
jgi:hypothetical protein